MSTLKKILLIMFILAFSFSMIAAASPKDMYDSAKEAMVAGDFAKAAGLFGNCSFYEDATSWAMYCNARAIAESGNHADASIALERLAGFADSDLLSQYCEAYAYAFEAGEYSSLIRQGADLFTQLVPFSDSYDLAQKAYERANMVDYANAQELLSQKKYLAARTAFLALGEYSDSASMAEYCLSDYYASEYKRAENLEEEEKYQDAYEVFMELAAEGYKDSEQRAHDTLLIPEYKKAESLEASGKYFDAYEAFLELGSFRDSAERAEALYEKAWYQHGMEYIQAGEYLSANSCFGRIMNYEDSREKEYLTYACQEADIMQKLRTNDEIAVYSFENEIGIINFEKNIMIRPTWSAVESVSPKTMVVCRNNHYGMADVEGSILIPETWIEYTFIGSDSILFKENTGTRVLYGIASRSGKVIFEAQWSGVKYVSDDFAITAIKETDGMRYGVVSLSGKVLTPCEWDAVSDHIISGNFILEKRKDKESAPLYDLMDRNGKLINPERFTMLGSGDSLNAEFKDGWMLCVDEDGAYGFISPKGSMIATDYEEAYEFSNERAAVKTGGFWGYLNDSGKAAVENKYIEAESFGENGKAMVRMQNGQHFILSKSGAHNYFIDTRYTNAKAAEKAGNYPHAIALYESLENYDDSLVRINICKSLYAAQLFEEGSFAEAKALYAELEDETNVAACEEAIAREIYDEACAQEEAENYEEAKALFEEIPDYLDSADHLRHINGIVAFKLFDEGKYEEAKAAFETLEGYEDEIAACVEKITLAKYNEALALEAAEDYDAAVRLFDEIKDYKDAAEHIRRLNAAYAFALMEEGRYAEARDAFRAEESDEYAEQISECTYQIGLALYEAGEVEAASQELYSVKGYKDVDELFEKFEELRCEPIYQDTLEMMQKNNKHNLKLACDNLLLIRGYKDSDSLLTESSRELAYRCLETNSIGSTVEAFSILKEVSGLSDEDLTIIYSRAKEFYLKNPSSIAAISLFGLIPNYSDSEDMMHRAMYMYVSSHLVSSNSYTHRYLNELRSVKYPGAQELYENVYRLKISNVCVNSSPEDRNTDVGSVKNTETLYLHFDVTGGEPNKESDIFVLTTKPGVSAKTVKYFYVSNDEEISYCFALNEEDIANHITGNLTFEICSTTSDSRRIVNSPTKYAAKSVYIYP